LCKSKNFLITCCMCQMNMWRKSKHIHNRQAHLLVRERGRYVRTYTARVQLGEKSLVVSPRWVLYSKTDLPRF
jgi:hypothetical protein